MATATAPTNPTAADVRAWARSEGIEVGERGYISSELAALYNKGRRGAKRYTPARELASA